MIRQQPNIKSTETRVPSPTFVRSHNVEKAIALAKVPHITVIGGAEICALFLSRADRIELTQVHATPPGDTFLDAFDPTAWQETAREDFPAEGGRPAYSFVTLRRMD